MKKVINLTIAAALALIVSAPLSAQTLHTNDEWDECAFVLDPSLNQESWAQFTEELGQVVYFRPLSSAAPMGVKKFEFAILDWGTKIDDADDAWNDTFSHPDAEHFLFDGPALLFPGLMFRMGVSERVDVGAYFTKNPPSNYGFYGGQVQYNFINDLEKKFAVSSRLNFTMLFGPEDLNAGVFGIDVLASKEYSHFSPYAMVSVLSSFAKETTSKVDLEDESAIGVQGTAGVAAKFSSLRLGLEYNFAKVAGFAFKIGYGS